MLCLLNQGEKRKQSKIRRKSLSFFMFHVSRRSESGEVVGFHIFLYEWPFILHLAMSSCPMSANVLCALCFSLASWLNNFIHRCMSNRYYVCYVKPHFQDSRLRFSSRIFYNFSIVSTKVFTVEHLQRIPWCPWSFQLSFSLLDIMSMELDTFFPSLRPKWLIWMTV